MSFNLYKIFSNVEREQREERKVRALEKIAEINHDQKTTH